MLVAGAALRLPAAPAETWVADFEALPPGPCRIEDLAKAIPTPLRWAEGFGGGDAPTRATIVERAEGGRALEILYPSGAVGPRVGGAQWMAELSPNDHYTLEYRVRFGDDFDWVRGGKLPGLAGGSAPSGGHFDQDGFTSRFMWRPHGRFVLYLYWAGQASARNPTGAQYAEDLETGVTLERGREYVLRQRVQLNTPGKADGRVQVWVDGEPVLDRGELVFRTDPTKRWQIDAVFFSTFHGGNDPSWAPSRDVTVQFDEFRVTR